MPDSPAFAKAMADKFRRLHGEKQPRKGFLQVFGGRNFFKKYYFFLAYSTDVVYILSL